MMLLIFWAKTGPHWRRHLRRIEEDTPLPDLESVDEFLQKHLLPHLHGQNLCGVTISRDTWTGPPDVS